MTDVTQTPSPERSGLAVTAFVLSLVPCVSPLGVLLGVVALLLIKKSHGALRGRGFALAAVITPLIALPLLLLSALPALENYRCGAAQSEARFVLRALHAAQEGFRLEHSRYASDLGELTFAPGGESHYTIGIAAADADHYRAEASSGGDLWRVDEHGQPENINDACQ